MPASEMQARSITLQQGARAGFYAFWKRAESGSSDAQAVLALMYLIGWVDERMVLDEATFWSAKSAQSGNAFGQWVNAWAVLEASEFDKSIENFILSAEQGFAPAIYTLGTFCFNGVIFGRSPSQGLRLIEEAARKGDYTAKALVARLYVRGQAGLINMLYGAAVLTPLHKLRSFLYRFKREKFKEDRLFYARSIVLENKIRRETRGEYVDQKYENRLAKLIPSSR